MNLKAEIEKVLQFYRVSVGNAILGNILAPDTDEATSRLLKLFRDEANRIRTNTFKLSVPKEQQEEEV